MRSFKVQVRYDGRDFFGWQRHGDKPTVQGAIEEALAEVLGVECSIQGAGRTDRGAHADGQVFSAVLPENFPGQLDAINDRLAPAIELRSAEPVPEGFHVREAAVGKIYRYVIFNAPDCPKKKKGLVWHVPARLDVAAMQAAAPALLGERDFASFAKPPNFKQKSTVRELRRVDVESEGPYITFTLEADGFLYKMVRNIVRALVKVGEGRTSQEKFREIIEAKNRNAAPGTAPASGLYLERVLFDGDA